MPYICLIRSTAQQWTSRFMLTPRCRFSIHQCGPSFLATSDSGLWLRVPLAHFYLHFIWSVSTPFDCIVLPSITVISSNIILPRWIFQQPTGLPAILPHVALVNNHADLALWISLFRVRHDGLYFIPKYHQSLLLASWRYAVKRHKVTSLDNRHVSLFPYSLVNFRPPLSSYITSLNAAPVAHPCLYFKLFNQARRCFICRRHYFTLHTSALILSLRLITSFNSPWNLITRFQGTVNPHIFMFLRRYPRVPSTKNCYW